MEFFGSAGMWWSQPADGVARRVPLLSPESVMLLFEREEVYMGDHLGHWKAFQRILRVAGLYKRVQKEFRGFFLWGRLARMGIEWLRFRVRHLHN